MPGDFKNAFDNNHYCNSPVTVTVDPAYGEGVAKGFSRFQGRSNRSSRRPAGRLGDRRLADARI